MVSLFLEGTVNPATLESIIAMITSIFTAAVGWVGTVAETVTSQPLLMLGIVVPFVGLGVGLFKRLLRL